MSAAPVTRSQPFPAYSRAEHIADAVLHVLGVVAALVAVPVLVTLAAVWHGSLPAVLAASVYGASLIAMFAFSAAYHLVRHPGAKEILRRLDHAAIYVKIAGTYTPFAVLLGRDEAATILAGIWTAALVGLAIKVTAPRRLEALCLVLYLGMGWAALVVGGPIIEGLSEAGLILMVTGGALYTLGVVFHLWHGLPFQNAIWHALVLAASFVFYAAILVEVRASALS
ncbi:hemolysin III family protein [Limibaculum sp. FT325]|uniref:PAQR family membrane homeostasis protein TrhA n=1 Tax=Thermohalobaculum sediminis TaxID=2939436 RepID=UPI0020BD7857|nr:hemolysin III family protein [Limibaculum sediminis]MCL5776389.1 hemolysin III family protein [Limibaculum sediminis]